MKDQSENKIAISIDDKSNVTNAKNVFMAIAYICSALSMCKELANPKEIFGFLSDCIMDICEKNLDTSNWD